MKRKKNRLSYKFSKLNVKLIPFQLMTIKIIYNRKEIGLILNKSYFRINKRNILLTLQSITSKYIKHGFNYNKCN